MASRNGSGLYSTPDKMATSFDGKTYPARNASEILLSSEITDRFHMAELILSFSLTLKKFTLFTLTLLSTQ